MITLTVVARELMSRNSLSRGEPPTSAWETDFYEKNWATASLEGLLNVSGNNINRGGSTNLILMARVLKHST